MQLEESTVTPITGIARKFFEASSGQGWDAVQGVLPR